MRHRILLMLLLLPLVAAGQGDLYRHYADRADLAVAQVDGFRLNDSVRVDVLILVADNDEAWQRLRQEFDIRTTTGATSWIGLTDNPARRTRWTGTPCSKVIASHARRTICIYRLRNHTEYEALLDFQINELTK